MVGRYDRCKVVLGLAILYVSLLQGAYAEVPFILALGLEIEIALQICLSKAVFLLKLGLCFHFAAGLVYLLTEGRVLR